MLIPWCLLVQSVCSLSHFYAILLLVCYFHYRKQWVCRVPQALGKDQQTLGKRFAECNTRQTAHGIYSVGRAFSIGHSTNTLPRAETDARRKKVTRRCGDGHNVFAECPRPDTRQTCHLCRVSNLRHSANLNSLPSVKYWTLGKDWPKTYKCWLLCRVSSI